MERARKQRSTLILVLGGAASGKSQAALDLAGTARPRAFVATGQALDGEMKERIERHRATRSSDWTTVEVPVKLSAWFKDNAKSYQLIMLDCLTLWLSNLGRCRYTDEAIFTEVSDLLRAMRKVPARVVIVSNELGMGMVPVGRAVRKFRDLAGKVNQQVAAEADKVHFVISGQAVRLK